MNAWGLWAKTMSRKPNAFPPVPNLFASSFHGGAFFAMALAGCWMPTCTPETSRDIDVIQFRNVSDVDGLHHPLGNAMLVCLFLSKKCLLVSNQYQYLRNYQIVPIPMSTATHCNISWRIGEFFSRPDRQNRSFAQNWAPAAWPESNWKELVKPIIAYLQGLRWLVLRFHR